MQLDLIPRVPPRRSALDVARERAEYGIQRAADATEDATPGWCEQACAELSRFAAKHEGPFTIEHARLAIEAELPPPNDKRAWGQATRMAAARKCIERVPGLYFPAASSNGSDKPVYVAGVEAKR